MTDFHAHYGNTKHSNSRTAENAQDLPGITNNSTKEKNTASFCIENLNCILSGGFEKNPKPIFTEGKNQLEIQNLREDWDHFGM